MLLNQKAIIKNLSQSTVNLIPIIRIESTVTSTNDILLAEKPVQNTVLFAESQTAGRGQFDRVWISPPNTNIYLSLAWHFKKPIAKLTGLSLIIPDAITNALKPFADITIKFPNDLMYNNKKLGGILIETTNLKVDASLAIIGIGLNINLEHSDNIDQPWTSLKQITGKTQDRNLIAALLLNHLCYTSTEFEKCVRSSANTFL